MQPKLITRKLQWVSSIDPVNRGKIAVLEEKLSRFYAENPDYYANIDFTADNWVNGEEGYKQILEYISDSKQMCEFGCGAANLLKHFPHFQKKYHGCDFSKALINRNREKFPGACFEEITHPNELPFSSNKFDLVFSVFVLEHSTQPFKLLDECNRVLQQGGRLVILCPDFLGRGRMSSQRAGLSEGTSKDKLGKGRYLDALLTLFDNRLRIPFHASVQQKKNHSKPQFLVNLFPTVFTDRFVPDVDAVYLTHREEIIKYLAKDFFLETNNSIIEKYTSEKKLIFLSLIKK